MHKSEQLISEIALSVATGCSDEEVYKKHNVTPSRFRSMKKRSDLEDFLRAYQHNLQSGGLVEYLTLDQVRATIFLSYMVLSKRPRAKVLELLDIMLGGLEDPNVFLLKYEERHGVKWANLS